MFSFIIVIRVYLEKVGEILSLTEEALFWKTAHYLIIEKGYRILQLSKNRQELWLENSDNNAAQVVRLLHYPLDWRNWLERDIQLVVDNSESIRRSMVKHKLSVLNLYFTPYPPVDDYQSLISEPTTEQKKGKVRVNSVVVASSEDAFTTIETAIGEPIFKDDNKGYSEEVIYQLKEEAIDVEAERVKAEKKIFHAATPFFTYIFLGIQIIIFILMEMNGGSTETSTLIDFGAKFNPLILEGEWWRFITPVFLHIGLLHLLMNSLALYYLGQMVERIFGKTRFLVIYLLSGAAGGVASFIFSTNLSAGASGAIFGLFGALLYFGFVFPRLFFRSMGMNMLIVLGINLVFGFTMPGIDNAGHIGGLIGGFLAAGIVHFPSRRKIVKQVLYLVLTGIMIGGMLQYGYSHPVSVVDEQSILIHAQDYIKSENYEGAYQLLKQYQSQENESPEILFLLSYTEVKRGHLENAKNYLLRVIDLREDFHEARYNLALIYLEQGLVEKAKEQAGKAVQASPDNSSYKELLDSISSY